VNPSRSRPSDHLTPPSGPVATHIARAAETGPDTRADGRAAFRAVFPAVLCIGILVATLNGASIRADEASAPEILASSSHPDRPPLENASSPGASLLFFPEEILAIEESRRFVAARTADPSSSGPAPAPPAWPRYLHLSALLRDADGRFEIWLNGRRHDRLFTDEIASLLTVGPDFIRLRPNRGRAAGEIVTIAPNQTLEIDTGRLFEGRPDGTGRPRLPIRRIP